MGDSGTSGSIPYSANSLTQLTTTITNMNYVGFVGSVDIWTTSASNVHRDMWLAPTYLPGHSVTIVGPTYTTGWTNPVVPYHIDLHAYSDAVGLAYKVCA
jgi:hypothetical protein